MKKFKILFASCLMFFMYSAFCVNTFNIITTSLPDGLCQHPYSTTLITNQASSGKIIWSKIAGTFPDGIQLNSQTGVISGSAGTFTTTIAAFTIQAVDNIGNIATRDYSITFSNFQILNTDFVKVATQIDNAKDANWFEYYDINNNNYDLPAFVAGSGIDVAKPATWYGNAPTYTITNTGALSNTSISGINTSSVVSNGLDVLSVGNSFTLTPTLSYKKYVAILIQSGTNAPIATVIENTIGNIVWSYNNVGDYMGTLTGAFPNNKTVIFMNSAQFGSSFYFITANVLININDFILVQTRDSLFQYQNNLLGSGSGSDNSIEIRVYN